MGRDLYTDQSEQLRMTDTKSACMELLALSKNYRQVMPQVLELIREYYAADKTCFFEYEKDRNAEKNAETTAENISVYIDRKNLSDCIEPQRLIHQYRNYIDPQSGSVSQTGVSGLFTVPVFYDKRQNGVLLVEKGNAGRGENGQEEKQLLSDIASVLAAEIQKCRYQ